MKFKYNSFLVACIIFILWVITVTVTVYIDHRKVDKLWNDSYLGAQVEDLGEPRNISMSFDTEPSTYNIFGVTLLYDKLSPWAEKYINFLSNKKQGAQAEKGRQ